jgi:hypothetical protein
MMFEDGEDAAFHSHWDRTTSGAEVSGDSSTAGWINAAGWGPDRVGRHRETGLDRTAARFIGHTGCRSRPLKNRPTGLDPYHPIGAGPRARCVAAAHGSRHKAQ